MPFSDKTIKRVLPFTFNPMSLSDFSEQQRHWLTVFSALLFTVIVGLMTHLWVGQQQEMRLREDVAKRFRSGDMASFEAKNMAQSMQNTVLDLKKKVDDLENEQVKTQSQRALLEQMYLELAKDRDEKMLSDMEQILFVANQELQLRGNVHGALIALESVDKLLSRNDRSQFIRIREVLSKDMEKLRALPDMNMSKMTAKLDMIIEQVEQLPFLSEERAVLAPNEENKAELLEKEMKNTEKESKNKTSWFLSLIATWGEWQQDFMQKWQGIKPYHPVLIQDVSISTLSEANFLKRHLVLRLLSAKMAIMTKDQVSFSRDMKSALKLIHAHYDTTSASVQKIKETVTQVMNDYEVVKIPDLSESIRVIQSYQVQL